eukprot:gb/GECH01009320.1/.p1 GENE.gb/GECH01009320.1/~~gb/GECH01009320.1/.p1  ORF type:complete len:590 (+),score=124.72 gb/GECH01009320.1/:1-1770(+)
MEENDDIITLLSHLPGSIESRSSEYYDVQHVLPNEPLFIDKSLSNEEKASILTRKLKSSIQYWKLKQKVKAELLKPKYSVRDTRRVMSQVVDELGLRKTIENSISRILTEEKWKLKHVHAPDSVSRHILYKMMQDDAEKHREEDILDVVDKSRLEWSQELRDSLDTLSRLINTPFVGPASDFINIYVDTDGSIIPRELDEDNEPDSARSNGSSDNGNKRYKRVKAVSSANKMLESLSRIRNPNDAAFKSGLMGWGLIGIQLKTPDIQQLKDMFEQLAPHYRQLGVDDETKESQWFASERVRIGKILLEKEFHPILRDFAKRGVPISLRAKLWSTLMDVKHDSSSLRYLKRIKTERTKSSLLTDYLVALDVRRVSDDDNYFVFEEMLEEVMLNFSRDPWIRSNVQVKPPCILANRKDGSSAGYFPPSGVVPTQGMSMLASPLCFLYPTPEQAYFVFRSLYARYWCHLHAVSSEYESFLGLIKMFENLLGANENRVFRHMVSLGLHPSQIAAKWIFTAFAGSLEVDQVLLLWDRIIGFDSLSLLPVLAAAIISFRSSNILESNSEQELHEALMDISTMQVVPLLQYFIFNA